MCTVTLIARRHGYMLGMNRDEKLDRVIARPPKRERRGHRTALLPAEPGGGTWVGVNDAGVTFALLNWHAVLRQSPGKPVSRGRIPRVALATDLPAPAEAALARLPLARENAFRLIGVFPAIRTIVEWRWNLIEFTRHEHPWRPLTWVSSGYDEPGAERMRAKMFRAALRQRSAGSPEWLRRLHRSHRPERGPYSHCMHRADAATVSYAEIIVTGATATLRYTAGAPCCQLPLPAVRLPLK